MSTTDQSPPPAAAPKGRRGLIIGGAVAVVLLVLGVVFATVVRPRLGASSASPTTPGASSSKPSGTGGGAPSKSKPQATTAATDVAAAAELQALHEKSLKDHPVKGDWVAVLATRYPGVPPTAGVKTGTSGASASGAPITWTPAQILADHKKLAGVETPGVSYVLLLTTDFSPGRKVAGKAGWVTVAVGPFKQYNDVVGYCKKRFPNMLADDRAALCDPKKLAPPVLGTKTST